MQKYIINLFGLEKYENLRKIPKNSFYNQEWFSKSNENLFVKNIESIYLIWALNKTNINIEEYKTDEYNYSEIYFVNVQMKSMKKYNEIMELLHSMIPNPLILLISCENEFQISAATKRINKVDKTKQVIQEYFKTGIIDKNNILNDFQLDLNTKNQSFDNFYRFYNDYCMKIFSYNIYEITWTYKTIDKNNYWDLSILYNVYHKALLELKSLEYEKAQMLSMWDQATLHLSIVEKTKQIHIIQSNMKKVFSI